MQSMLRFIVCVFLLTSLCTDFVHGCALQLSICVFMTPSSNKRVLCFFISMALAEHQQQWEDYVSERIVVGAVKASKCRTARDDETDRLERFKRRRLTYKTCTSVPSPDGLMASFEPKYLHGRHGTVGAFAFDAKAFFQIPSRQSILATSRLHRQ